MPIKLLDQAEALQSQGYLARAASIYRKLTKLEPASDPEAWLDAGLGLIACLRSLGQTPEAEKVWAKTHKLALRHGDVELRERLDLEKVLIDRAAERYTKSIKGLQRHLRRFQKQRDLCGQSFALWAIAGALRFSGDLSGSHKTFLASLTAGRKSKDKSAVAYALFGLGGVTRILGRLADSKRYYAQAMRLLAKTKDVFGQAYAHCGLANVLRQRGELKEALRLYLAAHKLYSALGDAVDLAYVDWGLGQIYLRTGKLALAEKHFRLALGAFLKDRETRGVVLCEQSLAAILHASGRTAQAEKLFDQTLARARKAKIHTHLELFT
ncbi:MAG: tetratricopeptide repeat protein [Elusimicrobiota bacterium]